MGLLYQSSVGVANSPKFTISTWVQRTTSTSPCSLLQFGDSYDGYLLDQQIAGSRRLGIEYRLMGGPDPNPFWPALVITLAGPRDGLRVADCVSGDPTNSVITHALAVEAAALFDAPVARFVVGLNELEGEFPPAFASAVDVGNWFHLFISADFSATEVISTDNSTFTTMKLGNVLVNLVAYEKGSKAEADGPGGEQGADKTAVRTELDCLGPSASVLLNEYSSSGGTALFSIPSWDIGWNGFEFGLPCVNAGSADNAGVRFGDTQIWLGQYITPSDANMAKFVRSTGGGHGTYPTDRSAAATAFGTPTFWFKGSKATFIENLGTGGSFTQGGSISDVAGPSF